MVVLIYMLIAFMIFFFQWRRYSDELMESLDRCDVWLDKWLFWRMIITSWFWPIAALWMMMSSIFPKNKK